MKTILLKNTQDQYFRESFKLYTEAFPGVERRDEEYHKEAFLRSEFRPCVIVGDSEEFMGILFWWQFEKLVYLEHFAMIPKVRCKGFGRKILSLFIEGQKLPILLEAEMPMDDLSKRRIGFYERQGFVQNSERYFQPKYYPQAPRIELKLMTYPVAFSLDLIRYFREDCHPRIFFRKV